MIVSSSESDLYKESLSEHSSEYSNESSFESSDNTDDAIYKYKDSKVDAASRTLWPCMKGGWKEKKHFLFIFSKTYTLKYVLISYFV